MLAVVSIATVTTATLASGSGSQKHAGECAVHHSKERPTEPGEFPTLEGFCDQPHPPDPAAFPARPATFFEFLNLPFMGDPLLKPGELKRPIRIPGGAVWQPQLYLFGNYRLAAQAFDVRSDGESTAPNLSSPNRELVNRLNVFLNLQLSGSERILVGFRPLQRDGEFTSLIADPEEDPAFRERLDGVPTTFFIEGDFGELFPGLDKSDHRTFDVGFALGRQPLFIQEGLLLNDTFDAFGLTRNTLEWLGLVNLRVTGLFGFNQVHRDNNRLDSAALLFGLFTNADTPRSTIDLDLVYVQDGDSVGDAAFAGLSFVQRVGKFNTALRLMTSYPFEGQTPEVGRGSLILTELSWTPPHGHHLVYLTGFWAIERFSSAARGPATGGPLGRAGILFSGVGLGRGPAALNNRAERSVGGALGLQLLPAQGRRQVVLELGGQLSTDDPTEQFGYGAALRFQQAVGSHVVLIADSFGAVYEVNAHTYGYGARLETLVKF